MNNRAALSNRDRTRALVDIRGNEMTRLLFTLIIALSAVTADGMDAGVPPASTVQIKVRDARFDGTRLDATVSLLGIRDALIDTRLENKPLLWPKRITTCDGIYVPFLVPAFMNVPPARGEELLLKPGYTFERSVTLYYLNTKLQPGACVNIELRLHGATGEDRNRPVLGTTNLQLIVSAKQ